MPSPLRSAALLTLTSLLIIVSLSPGCSQQGEGERCDNLRAGDSDCDSGLVCVTKGKLLDGVTDRCCKPDGSYDDSRCAPNTGTPSTGGKGGSGAVSEAGAPDSAGGSAQVGGAPAGGAPTDMPIDQAGQSSTAGMSSASDAGASSGGMPSTPAGGQGGAG